MLLNLIRLSFIILIIINLSYSSIIAIPFKILKYESSKNQILEKTVEDMVFSFKLLSLIDIGNPPQKIEASFDLKSSNIYISNRCRNCSTFYSYKDSNSFTKIETDMKPIGFGNLIYANETFLFYDGINNRQKKVENILLYLPELDEEDLKKNGNSLIIGLKFPDYNNNFQKTFIQQLKSKNIINQYLWTTIFYDNKYNKDYDGAFIFGDILNDYYPKINDNYSPNKIVKTYTGNRKKKNDSSKNIILEWGIQFDEIYYELPTKNLNNLNDNNNISNLVYIQRTITEFDFNMNIILGTFEYSRNIQRDFFNFYYDKNICKYSFMRNSMYKFIYCIAANFTQKDLVKFPSLKLKNKILRYIFNLDYKDLFSLTYDKKYYIFNIMIVNIYQGDNGDGGQWIFGLPFLKKYQFSFDTDNKLIFFYNKEGNFLDEIPEDENEYYDDSNEISEKIIKDENEQCENDTEITNNQRIESNNKKTKNYVNIKIQQIFLFIFLIIIFIFLFFVLLLLARKILFKRGFVLIRINKANELRDDFDYSSSKNINFIKNDSNNQECEMQTK